MRQHDIRGDNTEPARATGELQQPSNPSRPLELMSSHGHQHRIPEEHFQDLFCFGHLFPLYPSTSHMHLKPRTAARPDTNQAHHSMFRKNFKELKKNRNRFSVLFWGQVEDLFPHGSKMMAREREGWLGAGACRDTAGPKTGALLEPDAAWGPQDQMTLSTGSACSHLPWYVCCCWLVFHVFRKMCAWGNQGSLWPLLSPWHRPCEAEEKPRLAREPAIVSITAKLNSSQVSRETHDSD